VAGLHRAGIYSRRCKSILTQFGTGQCPWRIHCPIRKPRGIFIVSLGHHPQRISSIHRAVKAMKILLPTNIQGLGSGINNELASLRQEVVPFPTGLALFSMLTCRYLVRGVVLSCATLPRQILVHTARVASGWGKCARGRGIMLASTARHVKSRIIRMRGEIYPGAHLPMDGLASVVQCLINAPLPPG
jgi:hypothetical protein